MVVKIPSLPMVDTAALQTSDRGPSTAERLPHSTSQLAAAAAERTHRGLAFQSKQNKPAMPRQGPRRLPAGERDRRLAEEVLYLHSLWRSGPHAPATAPILSRSARRVLQQKERKRRRIDRAAAAEPALAPPPPASSLETWAEPAGAPAPPTANPLPPPTPPGPLSQWEAVPSWVEFTNRDAADFDDERSDSDRDKVEEEKAARYFTGLFQRDAWLRGHYTGNWRKGRFQCMVCAAGGGGKKTGKAVRQFRGCLALVQHARNPPRSRGRHGEHRALAAVVCRLLGWDVETLSRARVVIDARATAGVQHAKENDGAGENNGYSSDDGSYSIDEDEESDDEESVDEEDIETGMPYPATDGDEEDSEIESNEEYAEKEDADTGAGDTEAIELDNSEKISQKEAANSIAR